VDHYANLPRLLQAIRRISRSQLACVIIPAASVPSILSLASDDDGISYLKHGVSRTTLSSINTAQISLRSAALQAMTLALLVAKKSSSSSSSSSSTSSSSSSPPPPPSSSPSPSCCCCCCYYYYYYYYYYYLLQLSYHSVAVVLKLVQTKQIRINIHKRNTKTQ
jgi:hypothetical protein